MSGDIKLIGVEEMCKALDAEKKLKAVQTVVRHHGAKLQQEMMNRADFVKGYQTGTTKRSIKLEIRDNGLTAKVAPGTEYSPYLEYGTRFMEAQPFVRPALWAIRPKFIADIKTIIHYKRR